MKVSLLIATFMRDHLLELTLPTIINQKTDCDLEVIVINDGYPGTTEQLCNHFGVNYLFTGQRNLKKPWWRIPGFALNIVIKKCSSEIIIISCAEMYHFENCIQTLIDPVIQDPFAMGQSSGLIDNGKILKELQSTGKIDFHNKSYRGMEKSIKHLPFLLALRRKAYVEIGGYDEDFTGQASDDNDLMDRLQQFGCYYVETEAKTVHLYHPRNMPEYGRVTGNSKRWVYNNKLYKERKGIMVRNVNHEWGKMNES